MPSITPLLLLGGAGLPNWIWDEVISQLPENTDAHVVQYPKGKEASLRDYANTAVAQAKWPEFAVVAHSGGGVVAAELLSLCPERVAGLIGVSALFPKSGHSFVRSMPAPTRFIMKLVLRLAGTKPPDKATRSGLAGGLPKEVSDRLVADFTPESLEFYLDPTSQRTLPPATAYLMTKNDKELSTTIQKSSANEMGVEHPAQVESGHLPMLEDPAAVSAAITRFANSLN